MKKNYNRPRILKSRPITPGFVMGYSFYLDYVGGHTLFIYVLLFLSYILDFIFFLIKISFYFFILLLHILLRL